MMVKDSLERSARALASAPIALARGVGGLFYRRTAPVGARPGTLAVDASAEPTRMRAMWVDGELHEREVGSIEELDAAIAPATLAWVDVRGLRDEALLRALARRFEIHPLALSDIVHTPQRPKVDSYGDQVLVFLRMLKLVDAGLDIEQLSVVILPGVVVTFQEREGDCLEPVRVRLREGLGPMRTAGSGYLAYALIDTVIDSYFPLLEELGERLEELEDEVFERPRPEVLERVQSSKRTLMMVRRSVWPTREALNALVRDRFTRIDEATLPYLRDTYDHCIQVVEVAESYRELVSELGSTYLSVVSNRMNEVMKVLTVIASIFIPLTFLAGIYGMNFEHMPELHTRNGYFVLLGVMTALGAGMFAFFRRKGWLGDGGGGRDD